MALNNGLKSCATKLLNSPALSKSGNEKFVSTMTVNREIHSTSVKKMGGGHGHGHDEPYYLHAKHMYNLDRMKHQKLTMTLGVLTAFSIGVGVPVYAVIFQQKKTSSA